MYAKVSVSAEPPRKYVTQAYTGASPTTSTIAGMVSGSRQRNSRKPAQPRQPQPYPHRRRHEQHQHDQRR